MRVVHVVPSLQSGPETQVRRLCERLADHNATVTLISVFPSGLSREDLQRLEIPVIELPQTARSTFGRVQLLAAELRKLQPDVVHFHLDFGRHAGRMAAMLAGQIPVRVVTDDGGERGGAWRGMADRVLAAWTSAFVVSTEEAAKQLETHGVDGKKIAVIPSGGLGSIANVQAAQKMRRDLGLAENATAFVLPARLAPQKNQRLAMRALAKIYGDREDWQLFLHGEGPDDNMLRREAGRLHIQARTTFLGEKTDLQALLPAMNLFLIPSNWERLPATMGDAMLAGLPVVSTPWDGYSEFLIDGETGFVAADWSPEAYASAIERALVDPERARLVASRGRVFAAERFDMDAAARKHADLYFHLMRKARR